MMISQGDSEHDQLFLKLKILFAGYRDPGSQSNTVVQFFINKILYKSYIFVIDLRGMRQRYVSLKEQQLKNKRLQNLLDKIGDSTGDGRDMSKIEVKALLSQIKVISPYNNKISSQQHGVFNNLQNFIDIGSGIRKIHLKKANELLPNVLSNLTKKSNTKSLLEQDLKQTEQNYEKIQVQVNKKVFAFQNAIKFHETFFDKFEDQLRAL